MGKPVVEVVNSGASHAALQDVDHFFAGMRGRDSSMFMADLDVVRDGSSRFIVVRPSPRAPVVAYALLSVEGGGGWGGRDRPAVLQERRPRVTGGWRFAGPKRVARSLGARVMAVESVPKAVGFYLKLGYVPGGDKMYKPL